MAKQAGMNLVGANIASAGTVATIGYVVITNMALSVMNEEAK